MGVNGLMDFYVIMRQRLLMQHCIYVLTEEIERVTEGHLNCYGPRQTLLNRSVTKTLTELCFSNSQSSETGGF